MIKKRIIPTIIILTIISIMSEGCALDRRWYSTYKNKDDEEKTEHYNGYKKRWYKRNFRNGNIWK